MTRIHYMLTASGDRYALNGPELGTPNLKDIAHHLAQCNRFAGAAKRPYSVAEHSLLCLKIAAERGGGHDLQRAAFTHDWHEAYTQDVISPIKRALGLLTPALDLFERRHAGHVRKHFGLSEAFDKHADEVREIDMIALATELRDLMPGWECLDGVEPWQGVDLMHPLRQEASWGYWRMGFESVAMRLERGEDLGHVPSLRW